MGCYNNNTEHVMTSNTAVNKSIELGLETTACSEIQTRACTAGCTLQRFQIILDGTVSGWGSRQLESMKIKTSTATQL